MPRPVIALLTDFGLRDHYVGVMKGVLLGICPDAVLVDISHDIPPHDIVAGGIELAAAYSYFPSGCVFLVVVDPGVGSTRRAVAVEAGQYKFVAPDNGVLASVFEELAPRRVVEITNPSYARPTVSRTFEGRDRFAPAAAWLAGGLDLGALGGETGPLLPLAPPRARPTADGIAGEVIRVDRFGNLVTNIDRAAFDRVAAEGRVTVDVGAGRIVPLVATYSDVVPGELCALFGSSNHLEIAARGASAAAGLAAGRGAPVQVHVGRRA